MCLYVPNVRALDTVSHHARLCLLASYSPFPRHIPSYFFSPLAMKGPEACKVHSVIPSIIIIMLRTGVHKVLRYSRLDYPAVAV
jgi:hypothetical protein